MVTNDQLLEKLETLLKAELLPIKQGLSRLETRQNVLEEDIVEIKTKSKEEILQAVQTSQEDTITSLSEAMNLGYNMHEKRIVRIEETLHLPPLKN